MPLLAMSLDQVRTLATLSDLAETLATHFWPGGLTIILPAQQSFPPGILGPNNSLAIRIPDHTVALAIIQAVDSPIIGTSANISDFPSPRTADAAAAYLEQQVDLIIDGGPTLHQADSTIVDCTQKHPKILRRGAVDSVKLRPYLQS